MGQTIIGSSSKIFLQEDNLYENIDKKWQNFDFFFYLCY